jgi:hypothetical protein
VQADLFDSELESCKELIKHGYMRSAGALAGVVLEKHLDEVCTNHSIVIKKKNPTLADFNDELRSADVIAVPSWRFIQHLGDLRNLCCHNKDREPTKPEVTELVEGVEKLTRTLY